MHARWRNRMCILDQNLRRVIWSGGLLCLRRGLRSNVRKSSSVMQSWNEKKVKKRDKYLRLETWDLRLGQSRGTWDLRLETWDLRLETSANLRGLAKYKYNTRASCMIITTYSPLSHTKISCQTVLSRRATALLRLRRIRYQVHTKYIYIFMQMRAHHRYSCTWTCSWYYDFWSYTCTCT